MNVIIGFVLLVIAGAVMAVFEAVGGWPGIIAIVGAIAAGIFLVSRALKRSETARALRSIPNAIGSLVGETVELLDTMEEPIDKAMTELKALRAPTFWEHFEECCYRIFVCAENLDQCAQAARVYNERAREFDLRPRELPTDDAELRDRVEQFRNAFVTLRDEALTDPGFAVVFEQRRQGHQIRAQQQAMQEELAEVADTARAALHAAEHASDEARSARWTAKRAAGHWI